VEVTNQFFSSGLDTIPPYWSEEGATCNHATAYSGNSQKRGQATIDELGEALDLTPVTIRHHLDILRGEGLVEVPEVRRRMTPGRPQYVYILTETASDFFPKHYSRFADLMIEEIRERYEPRNWITSCAGWPSA